MKFLRDKSTQTILQFLLIILLIHLMIKKYINTYGSINLNGTNYSQLLRTEENNDIVDEEVETSEPESEVDDESNMGDLKNELVDYLDTQMNMEDEHYGVKGNKYYSDYREHDKDDENLNLNSFVKIPSINKSASLSVPEEDDEMVDDLNNGEISGFDRTYSGFAEL